MHDSHDDLTHKLDTLDTYRGNGTELISVYIPPSRDITDTRSELQSEYADAQNIKSKQTRQRVQRALTMIEGELAKRDAVPDTGLAIFGGVLETDTGTEEVLVAVSPPALPIESYRYHCDKTFLLKPLRALDAPDNLVGLLVADVGSAEIGVLRGTEIVQLDHLESHVPSKHRQGGQSAARFQRRRQETIKEFYKVVGDTASKHFRAYDSALESIVMGGPMMTRDAFTDGSHLHHSLRDKVRGTFPVDEVSQTGLRQLSDRAASVLETHQYTAQREYIEIFKERLRDETATYGVNEVRHAVSLGAVETVLLSTDATPPTELLETAEQYGASVEEIATDFEDGEQLQTVFGGVAALLRFPITTTASSAN